MQYLTSTPGAPAPPTGAHRVPAQTSYATIAANRLCGIDPDYFGLASRSASPLVGPCPLPLLCTRCGSNKKLTMQKVSRKQDGDTDDRLMENQLQFKTTPISGGDDGRRLLVPPDVIVIDAVSHIKASQCEAVMPGVGLNGPIRPLQGK